MVRRLTRLPVLDRKLLRDVFAMKGQALAIAAVMAAGVAMFIGYFSTFESLQRTRATYYERARFADVFASLQRAPLTLRERLAAIPGVRAVDTRVVADVTLDVPGLAEPATGRLISLPERGRPTLNDVHLRRGRWVDASKADEVLASEMFCEKHGLEPGGRVVAIVNGRWRRFTIVGVVLSPEYVYAIRPGEIVPDPSRFGIFWMDRRSLASAFDMEGGFNDVAVTLLPGAREAAVIAAIDRLLEPYGGRGASPRSQQASAWTVENELSQLQTLGVMTPLIFLGVAAFILHVALVRALALQRGQIAALKALGFANRTLAWHYVKWALLIAATGAAAGVAGGAWLAGSMLDIYNAFFRFPALGHELSLTVTGGAVATCLVVAALGAQAAVRRAVRVPPAEAMRPEPPARFHRSRLETGWLARAAPGTRMVLRTVTRQPTRALVSIVGIALAVAVLVVGLAFVDVMDVLMDEELTQTQRQHATLTLAEPRAARAAHDAAHLPGVLRVEPMRVVPVRLRAGARSRTVALTGLPERPRLNRVIDRRRGPVDLPPDGLVLSRMLADVLGLAEGDVVSVEVLEGRRLLRTAPIVRLVDDAMGLQAYMRLDAVARLLREGPTISQLALTLDPAERPRFYDRVKTMPAVAGVTMQDVMLRTFRETIAGNMNVQITINVVFAAIIAFGVVYNSARVSLSERSRQLASLRVLGFTRAEISMFLLGELALLTALALPLGAIIGWLLGLLILASFSNELYRLSFTATPATIAWSWLAVIGATALSGLVVRRLLDRLDLVGVLKAPE